MPRIFPYRKCPECGSSVLVDTSRHIIRVIYQGGRKISTQNKRHDNQHILQCHKCKWIYIYQSNVTKKVLF